MESLSAASALVLRDLGRADGKEVLKLAIKELVLEGTWRLVPAERSRRLRLPLRVAVLVPGDAPPPARFPLARVHLLVASAPVRSLGAVEGREVRALAKYFARSYPGLRSEIVEEVTGDLVERSKRTAAGWDGLPRRKCGGGESADWDDAGWGDFDSGFDSRFDSGFSDGGGDGGGGGD